MVGIDDDLLITNVGPSSMDPAEKERRQRRRLINSFDPVKVRKL